ncbi:MAG: hypothetical protein IKT56_05690 [Clostridia bacterium]|nr:hypothetical protein [Clostridia bacterium]
MFEKGFFGSLFDLNKDGKLDSIEKTMDFVAFTEITSSNDEEAFDDEWDEDIDEE